MLMHGCFLAKTTERIGLKLCTDIVLELTATSFISVIVAKVAEPVQYLIRI